jgi:hypothetical protein
MTAGAADSAACPLGVNPDDCLQHPVAGFAVRETSLSQLIVISQHSLCDLELSLPVLTETFYHCLKGPHVV